jgi:hypothetical protein
LDKKINPVGNFEFNVNAPIKVTLNDESLKLIKYSDGEMPVVQDETMYGSFDSLPSFERVVIRQKCNDLLEILNNTQNNLNRAIKLVNRSNSLMKELYALGKLDGEPATLGPQCNWIDATEVKEANPECVPDPKMPALGWKVDNSKEPCYAYKTKLSKSPSAGNSPEKEISASASSSNSSISVSSDGYPFCSPGTSTNDGEWGWDNTKTDPKGGHSCRIMNEKSVSASSSSSQL